MIGVAIVGLVACLHNEGLSRELAEGSSPTAEPEILNGENAAPVASSPVGDERRGSLAAEGPKGSPLRRPAWAESTRVSAPPESTPSSSTDDEPGAGRRAAALSPESQGPDPDLRPSRSGENDDEGAARAPGAGDNNDGDGSRAEASVTPSSPAESEIPGPPTSMATLLGTRRRRLEGRLDREGVAGDEGWVHYGSGLAVRYESDRAVEAALRIPAGLTCVEAARWAGFRRAMPPLYRVGGCTWPGTSARHRIHRGVVAELAQATGILQFWSAKASR